MVADEAPESPGVEGSPHHPSLSPIHVNGKDTGTDTAYATPSPPSSVSSITGVPPSPPSSPSHQPPHPNHPNPAFPAYPPLRDTLFVRGLRAIAGDDWAFILQELRWRPWFYFIQGHSSFILPCVLPFFAKPPTVMQLLLIVPVAMTLIGISMSVCLHRYFSHRAFYTSRPVQFILGAVACLAYQQGPLWWAGKHGRHHKHCDTPMDPHSWSQRGFWYAWVGWTCSGTEYHRDYDFILPAFTKCPELLFVDTYWSLPVIAANLAVWKLSGSFETMLYCLYLPMMLCRLVTLLFNVIFHPSQSHAKCKAIDIGFGFAGFMAMIVGEAHHKHHHYHPRAAHRPGSDYPWHLCLRWLSAVGLIWDCK